MKIYDAFFSLLRTEILGETMPIEAFSDFTEEEFVSLYNLSKSQDLVHLVGDGLSRTGVLLPEKLQQAFTKQQMLAVYRCERNRDAYERVCALFEENGIDFMPLKGTLIRPYYPEPWMRTSCDIDILIHEEDLERAIALIFAHFDVKKREEKNYHDVPLLINQNIHLELHFNLDENIEATDAVLARVWENATLQEGWKHCYVQSNEFLLLHLVAHNACHFIRGGCGARPFLDWWILMGNFSFDKELFNALVAEAQLTEFLDAMSLLTDVWFSGKAHTELTQTMEAYILSAGIYGSLDNHMIVVREKRGGRFGFIFKRIFLPYNDLKEGYPRLKRAPILYPYYTVVRWFRLIFRGWGERASYSFRVAAAPETEHTQSIKKMFYDLKLLK